MTARVLLATGGAAGVQVALPPAIEVFDFEPSPGSANATISFLRDGTWSASNGQSGTWISPRTATVGDGYEIAWQAGAGTLTTGVANTFQAISSTRTYGRSRTSPGFAEASGTIQIRPIGSGVAASSAGLLSAEVIL